MLGTRLIILVHVQTLRELHAEAAGRNEALLALEALTQESGARQERLREAMQACQHLQSELEAAQVILRCCACRLLEAIRCFVLQEAVCWQAGAPECGSETSIRQEEMTDLEYLGLHRGHARHKTLTIKAARRRRRRAIKHSWAGGSRRCGSWRGTSGRRWRMCGTRCTGRWPPWRRPRTSARWVLV